MYNILSFNNIPFSYTQIVPGKSLLSDSIIYSLPNTEKKEFVENVTLPPGTVCKLTGCYTWKPGDGEFDDLMYHTLHEATCTVSSVLSGATIHDVYSNPNVHWYYY